jgi:TonB-dependent SusC/RagA subfamily outer membrane receptor
VLTVTLAAAVLTSCGRIPFDPDPPPAETAGASQTLTEKDFGAQRVMRVELKDAVSTSIYGLRGANGVIKVTTKR